VGSSQYLYNAKMREEIVEQLGVTPTPGGLELLLRQSENNRMAHGGIVHLAGGGALINPYESNTLAEFNRSIANFDSSINKQYQQEMAKQQQNKIDANTIANLVRGSDISPNLSEPRMQERADAGAVADAIKRKEYLQKRAIERDIYGNIYGQNTHEPESTGDIVKSMFTPDLVGNTILSAMTGGLGPFMKWSGKQIWNKFGGQGSRTRLIQQMEQSGASQEDIDAVKNMSIHEFQKQTEGVAVPGERENEETGETETTGRLAGQDMSANRSTALSLMAMPTYGAMYNVGGSRGFGRGAGGNFGQGQRMIRKEQKKIKQRANKYDQFGDESWYLSEGYPPEQANYYANTFKNKYGGGQDLIDTMHDRGFGRGAYEAFDRVAESPLESAADSRGRPQNWSEIFSNYQETGSFDESPEAQWGGG